MNKLHEFRKEVSSSYFPISKTRDYVAYTHLLLILKTLKVTLITQLLNKKKKKKKKNWHPPAKTN